MDRKEFDEKCNEIILRAEGEVNFLSVYGAFKKIMEHVCGRKHKSFGIEQLTFAEKQVLFEKLAEIEALDVSYDFMTKELNIQLIQVGPEGAVDDDVNP